MQTRRNVKLHRNNRVMNFDVSLTAHLSITLANYQLDAQFIYYIYHNLLYVSSNVLLIRRRSNCINTASRIVTLSE
jgi:hypothetical protein